MSMPAPLCLRLDEAAHAELAGRFEATDHAETRTRYQMLLLLAEGRTPAEVGRLVRRSSATVRRVLRRYQAAGPDGVPHRPRPGQPPHFPPAWEAELARVVELDPHAVGVPSAVWTTGLLADYLAGATGRRAAIETVRLALHRLGFVCKRPGWSLKRKATEQPDWAKNGSRWRRC
jgi:transposase